MQTKKTKVASTFCNGAKVLTRSRLILLLLLLVILSLLSGCAMIDSSNLESAQTLGPGRAKLISYQGTALNTHRILSSAIIDYNSDLEVYDTPDTYYSTGLKLGVGLTQSDEIDVSGFLPNCYKLAWKHRFTEDSLRVQLALMPAISIGSGNDKYLGLINFSYQEKYYREYESLTFELPLLVSIVQDPFTMTACFKVGYNIIRYTEYWHEDEWEDPPADLDSGTFETAMAGVILSPRINMWNIVLIPEAGLYSYQTKEGKLGLVPVWNFGVEFGLGKSKKGK